MDRLVVQAMNVLAEFLQLGNRQRLLPAFVREHDLRRTTQAKRAMRQRVPDMLNQGIFPDPHAPRAVDVAESAKRRPFRDSVKAAFQMLAPHVAKR
jgi:hypothetical protein